jgi:hypothetical protein
MYLALINFGRSMGITITLETTNDLLVQVAKVISDTYAELVKAYREGIIYPLYGHATERCSVQVKNICY